MTQTASDLRAARALIAEMLEQLQAAERLYQNGLLFTTVDEILRVHSMRRALITKAIALAEATP